jgi:hypothetical protein
MSAKCTACGSNPVKNANYFITAKNLFGQTNLIGAANIGMCRNCICKYTTSFLVAPVAGAVASLIFAIFCGSFIVFIYGWGTVIQYTILGVLTAICLAFAVSSFIRIVRIVRNVRNPDNYVRSITQPELARIGARIILKKNGLDEGIFFYWSRLYNSREEILTQGMTPELRTAIREPFRLPMRRQLSLISFRRKDLHIPYTNIPDTKDKSVRELITKALEN